MEKSNSYKGNWDWENFFKSKDKFWRIKDYVFLEEVFDISTLTGTLLDVGCGLGDGISYFQSKYNNIKEFYAVDFSDIAIDTCIRFKQCSNLHFFKHNIMNSFDNKYDNVICLQTIEHLLDPIKAINNLIKATNKWLIVSSPYRNARPDDDHMWSFDENDFKDLLDFHCLGQQNKNIYWIRKF